MSQYKLLPEINTSQQTKSQRDKSLKFKQLSGNQSIEWDQLINTSIPGSVKLQLSTSNNKLQCSNNPIPFSDVSYLKGTKKGFFKFGSGIYKDPELEQTRYEKNTTNFYNTLYRKTKQGAQFTTMLSQERMQLKTVDFTELLAKDDPRHTRFQKYFAEIIKLPKPINKEQSTPPNRQQVYDLRDWLYMMLHHIRDESHNSKLATREVADKIQLIYATCYRELIKQVGVECAERGELMQTLWDYQIELFECIANGYYDQSRAQETDHLDQLQRTQQYNEQQSQQQQKLIEELQQQIADNAQQQIDIVESNNKIKAKMIAMTQEVRQLLELNEAQKKELDAALLQMMLKKTQDNGQASSKSITDEKMQLQFKHGNSIVSHLLNFQPILINESQKFIRNKTVAFDKFESLRLEENQLKTDLITQNVLKADVSFCDDEAQTSFQQMDQECGVQTIVIECMDNMQQTEGLVLVDIPDEVKQNKDQLIYQVQNQQSDIQQVQNNIGNAVELIKSLSLTSEAQEQLMELVAGVSQISEMMNSRIVSLEEDNKQLLEKQKTVGMIELMEKNDEIQQLQLNLTQAVQDFMEVIEEKKHKINKLQSVKKALNNRLNIIKDKYNIDISDIILEEGDRNSSDNDSITENEMKNSGNYNKVIRRSQDNSDDDNDDNEDNEDNHDNEDNNDNGDDLKKYQNEDGQSQQASRNHKQYQNDRNFNNDEFNNDMTDLDNNNNSLQNDINYSLEARMATETSQYKQTSFLDARIANPSSQSNRSQRLKPVGIKDKGELEQKQGNLANKQTHNKKRSNQAINIQNVQRRRLESVGAAPNHRQSVSNSPTRQLPTQQIESSGNKTKATKITEIKKNITDAETHKQQYIQDPVVGNDIQNMQNIQNREERIASVINQYSELKNVFKKRKNTVNQFQDNKQTKRFKRVYSQNTESANNLLSELLKKGCPKKFTFSILQLAKLISSILQDLSRQQDGYRIPFHVCIYDYFKNKYGFKQVAEKKIRQVYQYLFFTKDKYSKIELLRIFCSQQQDLMDETGQKLQTECYQYFSKYDFNLAKPETFLTFESVNYFLQEHGHIWLNPQQTLQLQSAYKQIQLQEQDQRRQFINMDQLLIKILNMYFSKKQEQETILNTLFQAADLDGNNLIEFSEFKTLFRAIHPDKTHSINLLHIFMNYADYQDENGDKMITLPRFAELSLETQLFQKEFVIKYGEGSDALISNWESTKSTIKYSVSNSRFLKSGKYSKVKYTFQLLDQQIASQSKEKETILWISYKLLNEESQRVILKYYTKSILCEILPIELLQIQLQYNILETIE